MAFPATSTEGMLTILPGKSYLYLVVFVLFFLLLLCPNVVSLSFVFFGKFPKHRRALREASKSALSGGAIFSGSNERALTTNFELLNLVPTDHPYQSKSSTSQAPEQQPKPKSTQRTKPDYSSGSHKTSTEGGSSSLRWRRVGMASASSARLDTIVWPGGDIVVSGVSNAATVLLLFTKSTIEMPATNFSSTAHPCCHDSFVKANYCFIFS